MANQATEEQLLYANILNKGMLVGLLGLIVTFIIYGAGILEPKIPLEQVQNYWVMPVSDYLQLSGIHAGWAWLGNLGYGDMLNFLPIAFLSLLTIVCYLAILPGLMRKKDTAYVVLVIIEVVVLVVAASGLLGSGGH
ncbi:MAG: hypothetical protein AMK70_02670 [Nitrospira bacterium SG8_35_1]|jgi:hypothetical protein|nr:MAG: hypothetical protein AMK70_02670 [Nitrospira bacterium SG8_35_1]